MRSNFFQVDMLEIHHAASRTVDTATNKGCTSLFVVIFGYSSYFNILLIVKGCPAR